MAHSPTIPDYESLDTMMVSEPAQLRALGDDIRTKIVALLRDRAASTTELAAKLGIPKGTAGHHVKVLERAGLVQVVRTRKVRAVTEPFLDVRKTSDAQYFPFLGCVSGPEEGAMGTSRSMGG